MSKLKVFVSSTCYDLSSVRLGLKRFIEEELGYEAVLSDQQDILYDPRIHTHTACIEEVKNSDLMILIIGSRFGGQATEEALDRIDFEGLKEKYPDIEEIERQGKISITQLEVLEAMRQAIPIFTFVVDKVYQDGLPGLPILARSWNCCTLKLGTLWGIVLYILILPLLLLFVNSFS